MERIRQLRTERGLSQAKLAVMAEMDPATLNRLEQGKGNPNLRTLERVADALGVGITELLGDDSPKAQAPLQFEGEGGQRRNPFLEAWKRYMHRRAETWEKTLEEEGDEIFKDPFDAFERSEWIQQEAEALIMALGTDLWSDIEVAFAHEHAQWEFAEVVVAIGAVARAAQKWRYRALSTWSTAEEEVIRQKLEQTREKAQELDNLVALFPERSTA